MPAVHRTTKQIIRASHIIDTTYHDKDRYMMHKGTSTALTDFPAYQALLKHHQKAKKWHLREQFAKDPNRFNHFNIQAAGLIFDYSKQRIDQETRQLLCDLAHARNLEAQRNAMFSGEKINTTEHRAVLHTALRAPANSQALMIDGQDVHQEVHAVLKQMYQFADKVRDGQWLGYTGKRITDIVNIGIGGSHLGPQMVCTALKDFAHPDLHMHFVANVDGNDLKAVLDNVSPETTLFIVASKTFTTQETMTNAHSARDWFLRLATEKDLPLHFVAVSTNAAKVKEFGIALDNMFPFWDWVGGRYSVWSAIGLSVVLSIGPEHFASFLGGAHAMDQHFLEAPLENNMPVMLGLLGIWNRDFFGDASNAIVPYCHQLTYFPSYLQQLIMESNGKCITKDNQVASTPTCPVVWGDVGTNGQHAFFQLLHQGSDVAPIDFIAILKATKAWQHHQAILLSNCFAQSEAFMRGKTADEVTADLTKQGLSDLEIQALLPHKIFNGNRPSNTLVLKELTPHSLGALVALYEHKVFVEGIIWGINSFDQWGVELGKVLAKDIQDEFAHQSQPERHDSSTNALIQLAKDALST